MLKKILITALLISPLSAFSGDGVLDPHFQSGDGRIITTYLNNTEKPKIIELTIHCDKIEGMKPIACQDPEQKYRI